MFFVMIQVMGNSIKKQHVLLRKKLRHAIKL